MFVKRRIRRTSGRARPCGLMLLAWAVLVAGRAEAAPALIVSPAAPSIADRFDLRIVGLAPGARVTVTAETLAQDGVRWRGLAEVTADVQGQIDLARQAPRSGTYAGI